MKINSLSNQSEKDEPEGFMHQSMGLVIGVRNPKAHELGKEDPQRALEYLIFISLLLKRLDESHKNE